MARAASTAKETVAGRPPPLALRPEDDLEDDALDADESPLRDGRNENSLAYLCQRFCEMYQNHSEPINIDLAAKELGIQRRRMYEILNIIQSVGLVGRLRASFYRWDGYDKMTVALERLKEEGLARLAMASRSSSPSTAASGNPGCMSPENQRRKAVATALGERFVQIFLCNEVPQPVILEDIMGLFASCVGGANAASALTNQTSCARRLYDIANVFCSIGLVRKSCAPATDNRRKKRLYDWIGPVPTATTTPLRPARLTLTAPTASPGSGSAKRVKREPNSALDTPRGNPLRKKSRLTSGGIDLEASIRKADEEAEHHELMAAIPKTNVLQHPAVVSLRGAKAGLTGPPSLHSGERKPGGADKTRAMLVARSLDTPSTAAAALSSLASVSAKASAAASLFNPPNAKDRSLSPFTARGGMKLPSSSAVSTANVLSSMSTSSSSSSPIPPTTKCSCGSSASSSSSSPSSPSSESPAVLKAQIDQLKKELHDARLREQELLRRVESQDAQIKSLAKSSSSSSSFLLSNSPLTNLAFSPFPGSLARDAFSSLTASPSPFQSSTGSFFSPGSAPKSGRPPFKRRAARVGPQIVDPTGDVDADLLPAASPHLSPGTTSIASSLLLSPSLGAALSDKENRLVAAARQGEQLQLLSPLRVRTIKAEAAPPSTPPHCQLLATAASSLLSLTPSQVPTFSPSIQRIFANDASDSELEPESDDATGGSLFTTIKMELADEPSNNQDEQNQEHDDARANTASPEPCAVRTPASLAAPSSPSPSAKNIKTRHALAPHPHSKITASSSTSSTSSSSPSSTPPTSSSALVASLEEFSSLASSRVTGCLS